MAKKIKKEIPDGASPKLIQQYSNAIRRVWMWSKARRLAVKRATNDQGFIECEMCTEVTPKAHVDHIVPCGALTSEGYFERLNVPSSGLQVLCAKCHRSKTKSDKSNSSK